MHYFWFVPLLAVLGIAVLALYFIVGRGLPKSSDRNVEGAQALEREEDEKANAGSGIGS